MDDWLEGTDGDGVHAAHDADRRAGLPLPDSEAEIAQFDLDLRVVPRPAAARVHAAQEDHRPAEATRPAIDAGGVRVRAGDSLMRQAVEREVDAGTDGGNIRQ